MTNADEFSGLRDVHKVIRDPAEILAALIRKLPQQVDTEEVALSGKICRRGSDEEITIHGNSNHRDPEIR